MQAVRTTRVLASSNSFSEILGEGPLPRPLGALGKSSGRNDKVVEETKYSGVSDNFVDEVGVVRESIHCKKRAY